MEETAGPESLARSHRGTAAPSVTWPNALDWRCCSNTCPEPEEDTPFPTLHKAVAVGWGSLSRGSTEFQMHAYPFRSSHKPKQLQTTPQWPKGAMLSHLANSTTTPSPPTTIPTESACHLKIGPKKTRGSECHTSTQGVLMQG